MSQILVKLHIKRQLKKVILDIDKFYINEQSNENPNDMLNRISHNHVRNIIPFFYLAIKDIITVAEVNLCSI